VSAESGQFDHTDVLISDPLTWVSSKALTPARDERVTLALFDRACAWRDTAISALENSSRPYRVAFSSESTAGIKAAIATGLAVGVLSRSAIEDSMQTLDERHGFPPLPDSVLILNRGKTVSPAISAMTEAIEYGFARLK
jgi:DNA-binding transcriptional LysR family regulator